MTDHYDSHGRLLDEPDDDPELEADARLFGSRHDLLWAVQNLRELVADLLEHGTGAPYDRYAMQALIDTGRILFEATGRPAPDDPEVTR